MLLRVNNFSGIAPKVDPHLIPDNAAQAAENCRLIGGYLSSYKSLHSVTALPTGVSATSIYRFGQTNDYEDRKWLVFDTDTDVARGQIAGDTDERTFWSNGVKPSKTSISRPIEAGNVIGNPSGWDMAAPHVTGNDGVQYGSNSELSISVTGTGTGTAENRYYIYTYIGQWGDESLPCRPNSIPAEILEGQVANVSGFLQVNGQYNGSVKEVRLYRTATGSQATDWQYVASIPYATAVASGYVYADSRKQEELGEVIQAINYDPPVDNLQGLINMPNGIMAGFAGNDIYFSDAYLPFSFPKKYSITIDYPVVGLGVYGTNLVAVTKGNPYIISGIDPSAMSSQKLDLQQACVGKRTIVSMGYGVMYASPDGFVLVNESARLVTDSTFSKRDIDTLDLKNATCCQYEGRYIAFLSANAPYRGLIIDPAGGDSIITTHNLAVTASFNDIRSDGLFLATGGYINKWDAGSDRLEYYWKSKKFELPSHRNFAWCQVMKSNDGLPVSISVYADGEPILIGYSVANDTPFRMPSGFKSKYWEIELVGKGAVRGVNLAESMSELKQI